MSMPFAPLNVGDINDDDGQIIDDLVQQQAEPPKPLADEMVTEVVKRPTPVTRLLSGTQTMIPGWESVMLLPKDEYRKSLVISVFAVLATDSISVGSDPQSARSAGAVYPSNPLTLTDHTGPVWLYNPGIAAVTVSHWAVTK